MLFFLEKFPEDAHLSEYLPTPQEKKQFVRRMFDNVAARYDFLNHTLSFGIDIYWRHQALKLINFSMNPRLLDLATGTADVALMAVKKGARKVVGVDPSPGMIAHGRTKILQKGLDSTIYLIEGEGEHLPLHDKSVDAATVAFGIRNASDISKSLEELARVLTDTGVIVILEFSRPTLPVFKQLYLFYFKTILPWIGSIVSPDKKAYHYLPASVLDFPERNDFVRLMQDAGFSDVRYFSMTVGIVSVYCGIKI